MSFFMASLAEPVARGFFYSFAAFVCVFVCGLDEDLAQDNGTTLFKVDESSSVLSTLSMGLFA